MQKTSSTIYKDTRSKRATRNHSTWPSPNGALKNKYQERVRLLRRTFRSKISELDRGVGCVFRSCRTSAATFASWGSLCVTAIFAGDFLGPRGGFPEPSGFPFTLLAVTKGLSASPGERKFLVGIFRSPCPASLKSSSLTCKKRTNEWTYHPATTYKL